MEYPTVQINDPKKPGDYLVIAERDFDPARHTLFGTESAEVKEAVKPAPTADKPGRKPRR